MWCRERVASHKRTSCKNVTAEELNLFAKRKHSEDFNDSTNKVVIQASKEDIDAAVKEYLKKSGLLPV